MLNLKNVYKNLVILNSYHDTALSNNNPQQVINNFSDSDINISSSIKQQITNKTHLTLKDQSIDNNSLSDIAKFIAMQKSKQMISIDLSNTATHHSKLQQTINLFKKNNKNTFNDDGLEDLARELILQRVVLSDETHKHNTQSIGQDFFNVDNTDVTPLGLVQFLEKLETNGNLNSKYIKASQVTNNEHAITLLYKNSAGKFTKTPQGMQLEITDVTPNLGILLYFLKNTKYKSLNTIKISCDIDKNIFKYIGKVIQNGYLPNLNNISLNFTQQDFEKIYQQNKSTIAKQYLSSINPLEVCTGNQDLNEIYQENLQQAYSEYIKKLNNNITDLLLDTPSGILEGIKNKIK